MTHLRFDIVVIGGGPAGAVAALHCARAGFAVCLLERQSFPRETLCGEFLSREVIGVLRELGLEREFLSLVPSPISRCTLSPDRGPVLSMDLGFTAYGMKRSTFDTMLLEAARSQGVTVMQPAEAEAVVRGEEVFDVVCTTAAGPCTIRGRWAIGAYGKSSRLDKHLQRSFAGKRTGSNGVKLHVPASTLMNVRSDEILLCGGQQLYCGINHVDGGSATICFLERRTRNVPPARGRIRELAEGNPRFAAIMTPDAYAAVEHAPIYGTGNIYFGPRDVVQNGMLMVGDAARVIAPLAGDGIAMAMQGAQLLGRLFQQERRAARGRDALEHAYRRQWERLFATRVRAALVVQRILLSPRLRMIGSVLLTVAPSLLPMALSMTRGRDA